MYIDATRDDKIVSDIEGAGLDVEPVGFTAGRKRTLIKNLITGVEAGKLILPDMDPLVHELGVFEAETTASGNTRYGAPSGFEDDCVDALALAYEGYESDGVPTARARLGVAGDMTDLMNSGGNDNRTWGDVLPNPTRRRRR